MKPIERCYIVDSPDRSPRQTPRVYSCVRWGADCFAAKVCDIQPVAPPSLRSSKLYAFPAAAASSAFAFANLPIFSAACVRVGKFAPCIVTLPLTATS